MLSTLTITLLAVSIFAAAILYASVGNAGASAYLAVMALFGLAPEVMKPAALVLNIIVAVIAAVRFFRAGHFSWPVFWPFAVTSIPFSYLGGRILLPEGVYEPFAGLVLLYVAYRLWRSSSRGAAGAVKKMPIWLALPAGAAIGFLAGLIGLGGGVFLTPLLLFSGWVEPRQAAGVSAAFNLVNSTAGLLGQLATLATLPVAIIPWAAAAAAGGLLGAELGSRRLGSARLQQALALVLLIAGLKVMFI